MPRSNLNGSLLEYIYNGANGAAGGGAATVTNTTNISTNAAAISNNSTTIASNTSAISALTTGAPALLNTLSELSTAIGDNAIITSIANKAPKPSTDGLSEPNKGVVLDSLRNATNINSLGLGHSYTPTSALHINGDIQLIGSNSEWSTGQTRSITCSTDKGIIFSHNPSTTTIYDNDTINLNIGASNAIIIDSNRNVDIVNHNETSTGLKLAGTLVTASANELNLLDNITPGTVLNNKVVVVDGTSNISGFGEISTDTLKIQGATYSVTFDASNSQTVSYTLNLPTDAGTPNQVLTTDGSNPVNLSWTTVNPDVVSDLSPQLGANLDVNGKSIVSVSNGNINITPNGSGKVIIDGISHPTTDGVPGQVLQTDGSGNLGFVTLAGGSTSIIAPFAFAYINTRSSGTGTGCSWGHFSILNGGDGSMVITFNTPQPNTNYSVLTERENLDSHTISVTGKTTTGFTIQFRGVGEMTGGLAPDSNPGIIKVYASDPRITISGSNLAITDIVQDLSPQLGANLDINGKSIVSVSNGNISLTPHGTGKVILNGLAFPIGSSGGSGQVLQTDGYGNLSWNTSLTTDTINATDFTLDASGDITLDAGANIILKDSGVEFAKMSTANSTGLMLSSPDDIWFAPTGGDVSLSGNAIVPGSIRFHSENNNGFIKIIGQPSTNFNVNNSSYTLTLPTTAGSADQVLKTDGSGNLSWTTSLTTDTINATDFTLDASGDITLDAGANIVYEADASGYHQFYNDTNHFLSMRYNGGYCDFSTTEYIRFETPADMYFKNTNATYGRFIFEVDSAEIGRIRRNATDNSGLELYTGNKLKLTGSDITLDAGSDIILKDSGVEFAKMSTTANSTGLMLSSPDDISLDASGDITLDAGGADVILKDDGTEFCTFTNDSGNGVTIQNTTGYLQLKPESHIYIDPSGSNKELILWSGTPLTLNNAGNTYYTTFKVDASQSVNCVYTLPTTGGSAAQVLTTNGSGTLSWTTITPGIADTSPQLGGDINGNNITGTNITLDASADITLDAAGGDIVLKKNGTEFGKFTEHGGGALKITSSGNGTGDNLKLVSNHDIELDTVAGDVMYKKNGTLYGELWLDSNPVADTFTIRAVENMNLTAGSGDNIYISGIKYPNSDGSADQVLKTDGSGNLSWTNNVPSNIDGTTIGANTAAAATVTSLTSTGGAINLGTDDTNNEIKIGTNDDTGAASVARNITIGNDKASVNIVYDPSASLSFNGIVLTSSVADLNTVQNAASNPESVTTYGVNVEVVSSRDWGTVNATLIRDNINNLIAAYDSTSFSSNTWHDIIGTNHTNETRGSPLISTNILNGYSVIKFNTNDGLRFPLLSSPDYTLFHVARYDPTGSIYKKVFTNGSNSTGYDWHSGFHEGQSGQAYHDPWNTVVPNSYDFKHENSLENTSELLPAFPDFTFTEQTAFTFEIRYNTSNSTGHIVWLGNQNDERFYLGTSTGNKLCLSFPSNIDLESSPGLLIHNVDQVARIIHYGNGTYRWIINGVEDSLKTISSTYSVTVQTIKYNNHYGNFSSYPGTLYYMHFWNHVRLPLEDDLRVVGTPWIISSDQNDRYRANGRESIHNYPASGDLYHMNNTYSSFSINYSNANDTFSDCEVAEILLFDRKLNITEIQAVEQYLSKKFQIICLGNNLSG